ncbi:MAG: reverse transcriptase/maturase family protein [Nitrospirae bacterium]|nr:reverse transcriptase/maturase family protein [Nitrospirota bacterium]MCL5237395.1 reverse transcriptase/maturase family protein [Nitrospirota bacterium]
MPKTYNGLFENICDFENLYNAYLKARRCRRYRQEILRFSRNVEEELLILQNELIAGTYRTGRYRRFLVFEPKTREIFALPFRDRVVHHAICTIIEPLFERKFIFDSYGCRTGKGQHAGSARLVSFLRRAQRVWDEVYCLKADVSKFFPSVDHEVLKGIIRRTIRCKRTLQLIDGIIDSIEGPKGIPIGNLTSQLFANIYLNKLDHLVKDELQVKFYVRYMDDFVILYNDKKVLHQWRVRIGEFLGKRFGLELHRKTSVFPIARGVDFLGYRTWPTHKLLRKRNVIGMKRRLKKLSQLYRDGRITLETVRPVIASWLGHAKHANSYNVVKRVLGNVVFSKNEKERVV